MNYILYVACADYFPVSESLTNFPETTKKLTAEWLIES